MEVIYGLIPMMLFFGFLVVVVFIWMAKKGYFDDMDGQANRILMDDDEFDTPKSTKPVEKDAENGQEKKESQDTATKEKSTESKAD